MAVLEDFSPTLDLSDRRIHVDPATRRIALRIASFDDVHMGDESGQVRMPRDLNLDPAHTGQAVLDSGEVLSVGVLPMDTVHAPLTASAKIAAEHYENTGKSVARVRYSIDDEGIRADGLLFDDIDAAVQDRLLASAPSGDWKFLSRVRKPSDVMLAKADFAGACMVNFPGFANEYSQAAGQNLTLVASAGSMIEIEDGVELENVACDGTAPEPCAGCNCGRATEAVAEEAVDAEAVVESALNASADDIAEAIIAKLAPSGLTAAAGGQLEQLVALLEERITGLERDMAEMMWGSMESH